MNLAVRSLIKKKLRRRKADVHKGDFGRIFIVAGSRGLTGSCRLASMAALRAGAGLVTVGSPHSLARVLTRECREVMWLGLAETKAGSLDRSAFHPARKFLSGCDVLALGPGLSRHRSTQAFARKLVLHSGKPMVIDADGIVAFWNYRYALKKLKAPAVLTPHPGEFKGLTGILPRTAKDRLAEARKAARRLGVIIVLKGHGTVVADPDGAYYVNRTGNPGMATAGSGDVLTGIVAAFLGQGMRSFEAACAAVYMHGLAGDRAAAKVGHVSLVAGDILDALSGTLKSIVGR